MELTIEEYDRHIVVKASVEFSDGTKIATEHTIEKLSIVSEHVARAEAITVTSSLTARIAHQMRLMWKDAMRQTIGDAIVRAVAPPVAGEVPRSAPTEGAGGQ